MSEYKDDRSFTDYVHQNLALKDIYPRMDWTNVEAASDELDMEKGVDYLAIDKNGKSIKIQERFRDKFYENYDDFTIRYERVHSSSIEQKKSEFYKIKADYLVYGITNGKKFDDKRHTLTKFVKFVIVDLVKLFDVIEREGEKINGPKIIIDEKTNDKKSKVVKIDGYEAIKAPVNDNRDQSSSFIAIEVSQVKDVFPDNNIIVDSFGY